MSTQSTNDAAERIVGFLSQAASYPDRPVSVQVVETHISWVFLTDRYAYKLKKPVRFEFLDFSTAALRHHACDEELRLNRRLTHKVYLDVLPITEDAHGVLELAGPGSAVDWVVRMRRLPADRALDVILQKNCLSASVATAIAEHLVQFYVNLPCTRVTADDYCRALVRHVRANEAALVRALPDFRRVIGAQLRYLAVQSEQVGDRVATGRVVDGHGDLRPEHIYAEDPPAVIDCIEFSEELRRIDIADELSFLAMECRRLGDGGFGELVLAKYRSASGDAIPEPLLTFYCGYRACVRAKVAVLRGQQWPGVANRPVGTLAEQYFELAESCAAALGPPSLLFLGGLPGSGKSTLAKEFTDATGAELFSTDELRRSMFGPSPTPAAYNEGIYRPEVRSQVYEELFRRARHALASGRSVVLDGAFPTRRLRRQAYDLGAGLGAATMFVLCKCSRQTALARIKQRAHAEVSNSEARAEFFELQANEFESPAAHDVAVAVDTMRSKLEQLHVVCHELKRLLFD